ncbi:GNAT family N-acetyltransferase [Streptomyces sp. NPDC057694]|uniref:GNAT family N-acetyltransferase n=1 Tax=Streptomyces sp. NPDC057694 TaxID=3346216 RepID=UPI0036CD2537
MTATVHAVDPHDEAALRAWYVCFREGAVAGRTDPLVDSLGSLAPRLRDRSEAAPRRVRAVAAYEAGSVVGALLLEFPLAENRHVAQVEIDVPPGNRRRGVGTLLFKHAVDAARAEGRTILLGEVPKPDGVGPDSVPGLRFVERHGFSVEHGEDHYVLPLPLLADGTAPIRAGYSLTGWVGPCPQEYLDAYVAQRTAMGHDVPTGTLDVEPPVWNAARVRATEGRHVKQGFTPVVTMARGPGGEYAGYTLILVMADQDGQVLQDDTLVVRAHRGHGLGAALKAANLARLVEAFPRSARVHTWVAGTNTAMLAVNRRFGFRRVDSEVGVQRRLD